MLWEWSDKLGVVDLEPRRHTVRGSDFPDAAKVAITRRARATLYQDIAPTPCAASIGSMVSTLHGVTAKPNSALRAAPVGAAEGNLQARRTHRARCRGASGNGQVKTQVSSTRER